MKNDFSNFDSLDLSNNQAVETAGEYLGGSHAKELWFDWKKAGFELFEPLPKDEAVKSVAHRIMIVPYIRGTKNHPMVALKDRDPLSPYASDIGMPDYRLDIWVHNRNIGMHYNSMVCLRNYNEPCPVCEENFARHKAGLKGREGQRMNEVRRTLYLIVDLNDDNKIKLFDVSFKLFEEKLNGYATRQAQAGSMLKWFRPDEGYIISFSAIREKVDAKSKGTFADFADFNLTKTTPLGQDVLDQSISLDTLFTRHTYAEASALLKEALSHQPAKKDVPNDEEQEASEVTSAQEISTPSSPAAQPAPVAKDIIECPHGHTAGKDWNDFDECDTCTVPMRCMKMGRA